MYASLLVSFLVSTQTFAELEVSSSLSHAAISNMADSEAVTDTHETAAPARSALLGQVAS